LIGGVVGAIIGIAVALFGKLATISENVRKEEAKFVNNSIVTVLTILGIASALLFWVIKLIFF